MTLINRDSIVRGQAFFECAHSAVDGAYEPHIGVSDIIGMAAWSLARCDHPDLAKEIISEFYGDDIYNRFEFVKELFNRDSGGGLWALGPAYDDVRFLHPLLIDFYPSVNDRANQALEGTARHDGWGAGG